MGGPGSGRAYHWDARATVESKAALDVRALHRMGMLAPGNELTLPTKAGPLHYEAAIGTLPAHITIAYDTSDGESVTLRLQLDWTPCNYGGHRPWFECPRCYRRVAILYASRAFLCRRCLRLAYTSTRENTFTRGLSKAQKIHRRLGGSADLTKPFPPKPKGMHWRTYRRLMHEANSGENTWLRGAWAILQARRR